MTTSSAVPKRSSYVKKRKIGHLKLESLQFPFCPK
jgi:hypothetical protein